MAGPDGPSSELRVTEMSLVFLDGPLRGDEFVFGTDVVSLGKAPGCDIVLSDATVSRRHAEIRREPRGYVLRDLDSTNGTFLDGAEIREAYLRSGCQVTLGKTRFRFRAVTRTVGATPLDPGETWQGLAAHSTSRREALGLARAVAPLCEHTVVLYGETGTGRRHLAQAIHRASPLGEAPLVWVDCAETPPDALEQRLFEPRKGLVERSAGGTLVLQEPWDLPRRLQEPLAEAIRRRRGMARAQTGQRAGGAPQRYVVLTSRDLARERHREHLVPGLAEVLDRPTIRLAPLRERPEDLAARVAAVLNPRRGSGVTVEGGGRSLWRDLLGAFPWPGNDAELEAVLAGLSKGLDSNTVGHSPVDWGEASFDPERSFGENKAHWVATFERSYLRWLLERHAGNVSRAARAADMDRKHLHRLLTKHGLR